MSGVLTRIKNNQILDATIYANAKIVPGSIVGSLFNPNLTTTSDVTIGGNLTVLGTSTYMTVASTNTYVNDPLIVLNNAFSGTNTYDLGFIFNRGALTNQSLIWSEFNKEFRFIGTSETGSTYGNVATGTYSNVHLGNLIIDYVGNVTSIIASGNLTQTGTGVLQGAKFAGNVALNGPNITTEQATIALLNTNATTVNAFGAATTIGIGASTGTLTLNNATVTTPGQVIITRAGSATTGDGQIFLNGSTSNRIDWAAAGTGAPAFTTRTDGTKVVLYPALSGSTVDYAIGIDNATMWSSVPENGDSFNFKWYGGDTLVANLSGTGNFTTARGIVVKGTSPSSSSATGALIVKGGAGIAGNLYVGAGIQATEIGNVTAAPGWFTTLSAVDNLWANASIATTTQGTGAIVVPNGGISVAGAANIALTATIGGAVQLNNTLSVGGISYYTNTTNATEATGASGALQIKGGASIAQDLYVGGNLYVANVFSTTYQVITVNDPLLYMDAGNSYPYSYDVGFYSNFIGPNPIDNTGNVYQHTGLVRDNGDNTWKFFSNVRSEPSGSAITFNSDTIYDPIRAGNLVLTYTQEATSATTGALQVGGGAGIGGNIFHTGTRLETSASNYIFASTPATVDAFKSGTDIEIGATTGTVTINNPTVVGTQATQNLYNTAATIINFAGEANVNMGAPSGFSNIRGSANILATTSSTSYDTGALLVQGGVGIRGNLNVRNGRVITVGDDLVANVYPENAITATTSSNAFSRISIQNISEGTRATAEFVAANDFGTNTGGYIAVGVTSSQFSLPAANILTPSDAYIYNLSSNIVVAAGSANQAIKFVAGGLNTTEHYVQIGGVNGNVSVVRENISTSPTTGAFTVTGGVGLGSNLNVARGAVINNSADSTGIFRVKGSNDDALILTDPTRDTVVIGSAGNSTPHSGVSLKVGGTGAMMIPIGTNSQRPGVAGNVDVEGMVRLNSSSNQLEYYISGSWNVAGSSYTIIATDALNGDGANVAFTLGASSTTAGTIVSINGVVQIPVTAYSISGTTLTFTEAPAEGDVIDVRRLTTTATVGQLSSGFTLFDAQTNWANVATGDVGQGTIVRTAINSGGEMYSLNGTKAIYDQSATNIAANATPYVVATYSQSAWTTGKYVVQVRNDNTAFQSMEALVLTDKGGNAYVTTYAIVTNGTILGSLSANVVSGNVNLYYTNTHPAGINSNVKVQSSYIV